MYRPIAGAYVCVPRQFDPGICFRFINHTLSILPWTLIYVFLFFCQLGAGAERQEITVWIIPAENVSPTEVARAEDMRVRVDVFNKSLAGTGVTVLNTVDPVLTMKLLTWNPAFAVPNAAVVLSQRRTLEAIKTFAVEQNVRVRVRFITWDEALALLADLHPDARRPNYPDVVQVGSTWVAHLVSRGLLMSRPDHDRGNWRDAAGQVATVLPFITDVRMLFYWKRLPSAPADTPPLAINASTWESILTSIRDGATTADTIAMPIGLTLNLLHDYAPLVWSGGGEFVDKSWLGTRLDLTSDRALRVPRLLLKHALIEQRQGEPRRLAAFPESSHEETVKVFVNGGYRAIVEPANFIGRWRQDFDSRTVSELFRQLRVPIDPEGITRLVAVLHAQGRGLSAAFLSRHAARARVSKDPVGLYIEKALAPDAFSLRSNRSQELKSAVGDRSFWDFAGAVMPPVAFRGGSDLVVLRGTPHAQHAFSFADFLATNADFTRILAEAGHLPAARPGYGIDVLLRTLSPESHNITEKDAFIAGVQRAIDQGRSYDQVAEWPTAVETRQALEALQSVWRRIAERDEAALPIVAAEAEWVINSRLNKWYGAMDAISRTWPVLLSIFLLAGCGVLFLLLKSVRADRRALRTEQERFDESLQRMNIERSRILLLHLHRAHRHDAAKFLGDNFYDIATTAADAQWIAPRIIAAIEELSMHFKQCLVPHIEEIVEGQFEEMFGNGASLSVEDIARKAFMGAGFIFTARNRRSSPEVHFSCNGVRQWRLDVYPYAAVVALEEWFLNILQHVYGRQIDHPLITVSVEDACLVVRSSGAMREDEIAILMQDPQEADLRKTKKGLPLIRNIAFYAFGARVGVSADQDEGTVHLRIPLPLVNAMAATQAVR